MKCFILYGSFLGQFCPSWRHKGTFYEKQYVRFSIFRLAQCSRAREVTWSGRWWAIPNNSPIDHFVDLKVGIALLRLEKLEIIFCAVLKFIINLKFIVDSGSVESIFWYKIFVIDNWKCQESRKILLNKSETYCGNQLHASLSSDYANLFHP